MSFSDSDPGYKDYARHLALLDQVIGLQAALAEEASRNTPSRERVEEAEARAEAFVTSTTWRVGRLVLLPLRLVRKIFPRSNEW